MDSRDYVSFVDDDYIILFLCVIFWFRVKYFLYLYLYFHFEGQYKYEYNYIFVLGGKNGRCGMSIFYTIRLRTCFCICTRFLVGTAWERWKNIFDELIQPILCKPLQLKFLYISTYVSLINTHKFSKFSFNTDDLAFRSHDKTCYYLAVPCYFLLDLFDLRIVIGIF